MKLSHARVFVCLCFLYSYHIFVVWHLIFTSNVGIWKNMLPDPKFEHTWKHWCELLTIYDRFLGKRLINQGQTSAAWTDKRKLRSNWKNRPWCSELCDGCPNCQRRLLYLILLLPNGFYEHLSQQCIGHINVYAISQASAEHARLSRCRHHAFNVTQIFFTQMKTDK